MNNNFYQQVQSLGKEFPPVEKWDPPLSGDMNCKIQRDGSWWIDGDEVSNARLVRLFSSVLKFENDAYYLITPVEKWHIEVEDLPFLIVELDVEHRDQKNQLIKLRSNVGDIVPIDKEHHIGSSPVQGLEPTQCIPFITVRSNLTARLNRQSFINLAELLHPAESKDCYTLRSAGEDFTLHLP